MKLTEGHKRLVERVHELAEEADNDGDNPTTKDLQEDDTVSRYYEADSVRKTLDRLANEGYISVDRGKPNRYNTTEKGFHLIKQAREERDREIRNAKIEPDEDITLKKAIDLFEEYFNIDEVEERILEEQADGRGVFRVDYTNLEKFNPELADHLISNPEEVLEAAKLALNQLATTESEMAVRFRNLPDYHEKKIRELSANDIGNLVKVPGIVLKASKTKPQLVNGVFECTSCGTRIEKSQDGGKLKSPYQCDCGNRRFEIIDKEFASSRILKLQEKPDSPDKKDIKVHVVGNMADEEYVQALKPGTVVRLTGIVKAEQKGRKDNAHYEMYIHAIDIEDEQNKWAEIELTDDDREQNREILEYGPIEAFQESLAVEKVAHRRLMKEAFLLYLLGRTDLNGNLHVLVMGEPGTGKSELNNWVEQNFPKTVKAVGASSTGVGLTATVKEDKDFGGYVAEGGSLTLADGGYHITDEFDKVNPDDVPKFNEALSDRKISIDKADVNLTLSADVSEWATANPREQDYFDPYTPKFQQIPIPKASGSTKDRFDVIIGVEEYGTDSEQKDDVITHILSRGQDDFEGDEPTFSPDELVKFVTEASRLSPSLSKDVRDRMKEIWFDIKQNEDDDEERLITNRTATALYKLSVAYARADLSEEVREEHVEKACDFYRRALESIDFEVGEDSFTEIQSKEETDTEKVRTALEDVEEENPDDVALFEDIVEESGLAEDRVMEILKRLSREGEVFQPRGDPDTWKRL